VVVEKVGAVVATVLVAAAVIAPSRRARAMALAGAMILTPAVLLADVWDTAQVQDLRARPGVAAALAALAVASVLVGAALIVRRPAVLPLAAVAALPFRIPLHLGGTTANLLVPLYVVIAAGAVAHVATDVRGADGDRAHVRTAEWLLLGFVVLYAVQATYSADASQAVQHIGFFYVPFAMLYALLRDVRWTPQLLGACVGVLAGLAVAFCAVALVQEATRHVFLNDKLRESNVYNPYFRVNSLFFDPNIFGRFLVVVLLLLAPVAAWSTDRRRTAAAVAVLVVVWLGLLATLSQSSLGALLVGLAVLTAAAGAGRRIAVPAAVLVTAGVVLVVAFPGALRLQLDSAGSVRKATSGRSDLVSGGADLFAKRPLVGWGSGAFPVEYARRHRTDEEADDVSASHTIPLTVAVEQGVIGLAAYLALLVAALALLLRGARDALPRAAIAAVFAAIVLHSFGYAAFLEDPATWAALAVGAALAAQRSSRATSVSPTSRNSL
jgi:O-Antigen ligase